jgi:NAD(P)-dependent dehydrogenase (short-subunit alcohol dehydrogenase family)
VKVIVIGATGTVGAAVVEALSGSHEVVSASRHSEPRVDLDDPRTIEDLFTSVEADAAVCCAANAPLGSITESSDEELVRSIAPKLLGQLGVAVHAAMRLNDGGSITLTSGRIPEDTPGSAGGAMVNAGLEAFVRAVPHDLDRGLRINAVSPGWVRETLLELGMDATDGIPARDVARAYVAAVEGEMQGEVLRPGWGVRGRA